jgi:hypothetical protein
VRTLHASVVLFASSLFFAGISFKLQTARTRVAILTLGCVLFLGTAIWIANFPTRVTI